MSSSSSSSSSESSTTVEVSMIKGGEETNDLLQSSTSSSTISSAPNSSLSSSSSSSSTGAIASGHDGIIDSAYMRKVLPVLSLWLTMSMVVILFNKFLFMGPFKHPLTLCTIHMCFISCATQILSRMGALSIPQVGWTFYAKNIVPLGAMYALSLSCSNYAAMRLTVSFIQMIKAVTPMMTLAVSVAYGTEKPYFSLQVITLMMTFGVGVASYGEIEFDMLGMALQLTALTVESIRLVAMQRMNAVHMPKSNPLILLSLFAPVCFIFLFPIALFVEQGALAKLAIPATGFTVALNTLTAFGLNFAVVLMISQESGALTLTLAGIIKDIALIVSSIYLFGNPVTYIQVAGYTLALLGLNCYHRIKAGKNSPDGNISVILREASSDQVFAVMAFGMVVLLFFAKR
jgi:hypothetical protein